MATALHARTDRTHLFPGAVVIVDTPDELVAAALRLEFSDGAAVEAELLAEDDGDLVLSVEGYTTGAGTDIPGKLWTLAESRRRDDESVEFRIGARLPFAPGP